MAKKPRPWYREDRDAWYVTIAGTRHRLGAHPDDAPTPKRSPKTGHWNSPRQIDAAFQALLHGNSPTSGVVGETVVNILDDFISWSQENKSAITTQRYREYCQSFVDFRIDGGIHIGALSVDRLTSKHVTQWLGSKKWGPTTKRNAITALQRGFNWAVKNRGLQRNPIYGMEKPKAKTRTSIISSPEFEKILAEIPDEEFRDLLIVSYDSGARPFEIKNLERRHVQIDRHIAVVPAVESKGRTQPRTIYFPTTRSTDIISRLCEEHTNGSLFRNRRGNKWTASAVKCRLEDLDHVLGRRVRQYDLRHSWITRKLIAGVDSHIVAKLAGHRDTKMLDTTYSHVAQDYAFMLEQAKRDL
jgi:site-specific recombinase XerD